MREKLVVDHRRLIAVTPYRMPRSSGCVLDNRNLEAFFEKVAQMGLNAHVCQHAAEEDLTHPPFAQLQDEIVGLRAPNLVRADDDRSSVFNVGLEAVQPVRTRVREAGQVQRSGSSKRVGFEL